MQLGISNQCWVEKNRKRNPNCSEGSTHQAVLERVRLVQEAVAVYVTCCIKVIGCYV